MSRENAGIILEIIEGVHKGQFAIAPADKQHESFKQIRSVFVRLFHDRLCQQPVMHEGKKVISLVKIDYCKQIGFVD